MYKKLDNTEYNEYVSLGFISSHIKLIHYMLRNKMLPENNNLKTTYSGNTKVRSIVNECKQRNLFHAIILMQPDALFSGMAILQEIVVFNAQDVIISGVAILQKRIDSKRNRKQ